MLKHYQQIPTVQKYKFSELNYFDSKSHQYDNLLHKSKNKCTYIFMVDGLTSPLYEARIPFLLLIVLPLRQHDKKNMFLCLY